jgi:hypothetical protein
MQQAIQQFRQNILRARELGNLASAVQQITTTAIDVSDMWRAQIVLGVSALDYFVHELTRLGMIDVAKGNRPKTDAYLKFSIPIDAAERGLAGQTHELWLGNAVRDRHSWLSFQQPEKIADAVRLISSVILWDAVGSEVGLPPKDAKLRLQVIVDRRNQIAHEADMDPANPGFRWSITEADAADSLDYIGHIAEAVFKVAV